MTTQQLRDALKREPFQPFDINMADGRKVRVAHAEFVAISPSGRTIHVYAPDESSEIIDLLLVTILSIPKNGIHASKRRS